MAILTAGRAPPVFLARASVLLGRIGDAVRATEDAIALAQALEHPFSLALAHVFASAVAQACRQPDRVRVHRAKARRRLRAIWFHRSFCSAWSSVFEGWAAVATGIPERAAGSPYCRSADHGIGRFRLLAGVAAEAYLISGNAADRLASVADGLRVAARAGERFLGTRLLRPSRRTSGSCRTRRVLQVRPSKRSSRRSRMPGARAPCSWRYARP